jgi:polysaccharide biosynthesis/export protein
LKMRVSLLVMIIAGSVLAAAPLAAQAPRQAAPSTPQVLNPGDMVRITVWRKPELSGEYPVAADGTIADPFYMDVSVGGLTLASASERVRAHVAIYENEPRVLVEPLFRVAVGGEVQQPSLYNFRPEISIAQAVMLAGGPTERGRVDEVRVIRDGRELVVDLTDPEGGVAATPIRSGDQILVARRRSIVRDYIAPASSILGAALAITNTIRRW